MARGLQPDGQLVDATDVVPERARAFADDHGMAAARDVDALLEHGLDALYVCIPPFAHGPV